MLGREKNVTKGWHHFVYWNKSPEGLAKSLFPAFSSSPTPLGQACMHLATTSHSLPWEDQVPRSCHIATHLKCRTVDVMLWKCIAWSNAMNEPLNIHFIKSIRPHRFSHCGTAVIILPVGSWDVLAFVFENSCVWPPEEDHHSFEERTSMDSWNRANVTWYLVLGKWAKINTPDSSNYSLLL